MNGKTEVVVVGGGYGGVTAANRLARRDGMSVTLVNPRADFVERIRLHQLVTGSDDAVEDFRKIMGAQVRLVIDTVTRIDAAGRQVSLAGGGSLSYDYLVYAVGSGAVGPGVPGAAEFTHRVSDLEGAERLRSALAATSASEPVTVVGAGPTGLETAAELAEAGRRVTLVCGDVLGPSLHARVRRPVARRLTELGVAVLEGPSARVTEVTPDRVRLDGGRELPSAVTIWTAGFGVPDLAARSGLSTDAEGRLITDTTLTSVDDERIVAAGDAGVMPDHPFRMSCQAAVQLGPAAADTILRRIAGKKAAPVRMFFAGQCLSLGRDEGVTQFSYPDDKVNALRISGRPGAGVKEIACRFTLNKLVSGARKAGSRS
ncbi:NADH dehydrogenase [Streptomyces malachitofuscus]|nr:NADH dehydrogenase [Streptomyces malachitofuscus]